MIWTCEWDLRILIREGKCWVKKGHQVYDMVEFSMYRGYQSQTVSFHERDSVDLITTSNVFSHSYQPFWASSNKSLAWAHSTIAMLRT